MLDSKWPALNSSAYLSCLFIIILILFKVFQILRWRENGSPLRYLWCKKEPGSSCKRRPFLQVCSLIKTILDSTVDFIFIYFLGFPLSSLLLKLNGLKPLEISGKAPLLRIKALSFAVSILKHTALIEPRKDCVWLNEPDQPSLTYLPRLKLLG